MLPQSTLIDPSLDNSRLVQIYQTEYKLPKADAENLLNFQREELLSVHRELQYNQLELEIKIANATTLDEVLTIYQDAQMQMFLPFAGDISRVL